MKELLEEIIAAWEKLPSGDHPAMTVELWLIRDMKPAIDKAREALGLPTNSARKTIFR